MEYVIWFLQAIMALVFMYSGICKSYYPIPILVAKGQTGVEHLPLWFVRFIGASEILGAVGLILPQLLNSYPFLTPISALCLAFIMPFAAFIHYRRKEYSNMGINFTVLMICLTIAWFRMQ